MKQATKIKQNAIIKQMMDIKFDIQQMQATQKEVQAELAETKKRLYSISQDIGERKRELWDMIPEEV